MRELLTSVREFGARIISHVFFVAVGVVGGILGIVDAVSAAVVKPGTTPFSIPFWIWLFMLVGGFLVAVTWAFHDVRMERDAVKGEIERRFSAIRYALQRETIDYRVILCPDGTRSIEAGIRLKNNSAEYVRYEMEHMEVVLE